MSNKDKYIFLHKKAKQLRKHPTSAEVVFERKLKELNVHYVSQWPYIAGDFAGICDFCLPVLFVLIEIDGGYHEEEEQKQTDAIKDFICENQLVAKVLRFTNKQALYLSSEQIRILIKNASDEAEVLRASILPSLEEKKGTCSHPFCNNHPIIYKIENNLFCKKHGMKKKRKIKRTLGLLSERSYGNMW